MTRLNGRLRGKSYATDILSFEAPGPVRETGWLGELVICRPTLMRQAREHGHSPATELEILVIHGLLHLLGFDHEGQGPKAQRAAREMARHEGALLGRASKGLIGRTQPSVRS